MVDFVSEHLGKIMGLLVAALATGFVVKISIDRRRVDGSKTKTDQSGSIVGRDQAGRDINRR